MTENDWIKTHDEMKARIEELERDNASKSDEIEGLRTALDGLHMAYDAKGER